MADIAQAFLRLRADGTGFREEAGAAVKKSTTGLKAKIPLAADDKEASASVDRLKVKLAALSAKIATVTLDANDKPAQVRVARLAVALNELRRKVTADITVDGVTK